MLPPRIIPTLLLKNKSFVKGSKFRKHSYVGDPLNVIKLFNDLQASEILILGIDAREENGPDFDYLNKLSSQAFMPMSYGGNINSFTEASKIISIGFEKVVLNTVSFLNPDIISQISDELGSSSTVGCIDIKKNYFFNDYKVFSNSGKKKQKIPPQELAIIYQEYGAGELIINSIDLDGSSKGYDLNLIKSISQSIDIPLIISGGAGSLEDFKKALNAGASAVAAGNFFVYKGEHKAVLVSYPEYDVSLELLKQ